MFSFVVTVNYVCGRLHAMVDVHQCIKFGLGNSIDIRVVLFAFFIQSIEHQSTVTNRKFFGRNKKKRNDEEIVEEFGGHK